MQLVPDEINDESVSKAKADLVGKLVGKLDDHLHVYTGDYMVGSGSLLELELKVIKGPIGNS